MRFQQLIDSVSNIGINREKNVTLHIYIVYSNLLAVSNSVSMFIVSILLFLFINNPLCASACLFVSINQFVVLYLNSKGKNLIARLHLFLSANFLLIIYSMVFSHKTALDTYFIVVCMAPVLMFSAYEIKWLIFTYIISFVNLIIEYTSLEDYLPNYHLLTEVPMVDYAVLLGLILMIINQVGIYTIIQTRVQNELRAVNKELNFAHLELEKHAKDLEIFGVTATHDLKAPISVSRIFTQIIERSLRKEKIDKVAISESVETISTSFNQMETLIDSYVYFIKVLQLNITKEPVNALQEFDTISKNLLAIYPNAKIILPEEEIVLVTNKMLFTSVIQNLLQNGLKYNKSAIPSIAVDFVKHAKSIAFKITDNGLGIDANFKDDLFLPFKRFHNEIEGTGLGLTISKKAAQKLGGDLNCAKSDLQGSTFILEIPIQTVNLN